VLIPHAWVLLILLDTFYFFFKDKKVIPSSRVL